MPRNREPFSVNAFRFSIAGPDGTPYDQVAKPGTFVKDGEEVVFDETNLSQFINGFAKQVNPIPGDVEHQVCYVPQNGNAAPLAAKYDSLALVWGGKLAKFHSQSGQAPPDVAGWGDGLYARRSETTPHGIDLLKNKGYGFISPTFQTEGSDEQGNPTGYSLLTASWVVLPFLDGMEPVTFHRLTSTSTSGARRFNQEKQPMDELYKKLGLADGCSADEMKGAFAKYMSDSEAKIAEQEKALKKFAEGAEGEHREPDGDEAKNMQSKLAKMAADLGVPASLDAISAAVVPLTKFSAVEQRLAAVEAERASEKQAALDVQIGALVDGAIASGYPADQRANLTAFAKADMAGARKFVEGLPGAKVFTRLTAGGAPVVDGANRSSGTQHSMTAPSGQRFQVRGIEFSRLSKERAAKDKIPLAEAQRLIARERPEVAREALALE